MKKINFDKAFTLGLYSYLRQVELSIDRVLSGSWEDLVAYFGDKIPPQKVISYLDTKASGKIELALNSDIFSALMVFSALLAASQPPDREDLIQLRMQLNSYCNRLEKKLPKEDINKAQYIEHYNQNEFLRCTSLEEVVGGMWLA